MQIEEAKDAIARLIRDAIPASTAPVAASSRQGGINFFGGTNVVQIHIAAQPEALEAPTIEAAASGHPAISGRRRDVLVERIEAMSKTLARPDYHLRFVRSVYGHGQMQLLDEVQLARVMAFLESEAEHR